MVHFGYLGMKRHYTTRRCQCCGRFMKRGTFHSGGLGFLCQKCECGFNEAIDAVYYLEVI